MKFILFLLLVLFYLTGARDIESHTKTTQTDTCGHACSTHVNCNGQCPTCRQQVCVDTGYCGSWCDPSKSPYTFCYAGQCKDCNPQTKTCVPGCGGRCFSDEDCYGNCSKCILQRCIPKTGGCGLPCGSNSDCEIATDGCTKCLRNQCVKGGCGSMCYWQPDCNSQGNCTQCMGRFPGGYGLCVSGCNMSCVSNADCAGNMTDCGLCRNGKCSASDKCGVSCMGMNGCAGNCHRCIDGACSPNAACGAACETNAECDQLNCPFCNQGRCHVS